MNTISTSKSVKEIGYKELMQLISEDACIKIVDVRDKLSYDKGHIKGAISIPLPDIHAQAKNFLEDDTIVTYCDNYKYSASIKAAEILLALGYNVLNYKGGIDGYQNFGLSLGDPLYSSK